MQVCREYSQLSRRAFLMGGLTIAAATTGLSQALLDIRRRDRKRALVVLFLRGGADGLNTVVPVEDDAYYRLRPSLAIPKSEVIDLDGSFGFHPALQPIRPLFADGKLAVVQAVGSDDRSRSHFEAMNAMERGVAEVADAPSDGWLARYLAARNHTSTSPLTAVSFSSVKPDSLIGATHSLALESIESFRLDMPQAERESVQAMLRAIYSSGEDSFSRAGRETLEVLEKLSHVARQNPVGKYPDSDLGASLRQAAFLLRSDLGAEVICVERGGWDTHVAQGSSAGWHASLLTDLSQSLAAFAEDLGPMLDDTTVVVMTEFGRRAYENTGLGTDHGRASFMLVLGGGVRGGQVHGDWPGLAEDQLEEPGDLRVTTDYRSVLAEVLTGRMDLPDASRVFPGLEKAAVGVLGA